MAISPSSPAPRSPTGQGTAARQSPASPTGRASSRCPRSTTPQFDDAINDSPGALNARDDIHATARYRRELVRRLGRETLEEAKPMPRLNAAQRHPVDFTLNGRTVTCEAENRMLLSDLLRHEVGATGTHVGCEHGVCGACTVQIDGKPARACLTLAGQVDGSDIRTVEGLAPEPGRLSVLQAAFRTPSRACNAASARPAS